MQRKTNLRKSLERGSALPLPLIWLGLVLAVLAAAGPAWTQAENNTETSITNSTEANTENASTSTETPGANNTETNTENVSTSAETPGANNTETNTENVSTSAETPGINNSETNTENVTTSAETPGINNSETNTENNTTAVETSVTNSVTNNEESEEQEESEESETPGTNSTETTETPGANSPDTTAPTVASNPAHGSTTSARSGDIVLTFSEPVYADDAEAALTEQAASSLVELKQNDQWIAFTPSVTTSGANTVITIDPKQELDDGKVSVQVSSAFYDASGNRGSGMKATFTVADAAEESEEPVTNNTDTTAPTVTIEPANGTTINVRSGNIVLTFSEPVYADTSQTALTAKTAEDLMDLKQNNKGIAFTPSVTTSGANTVITLDPKQDLADGNVSVKVSSAFYDASGNQGSGMNATFTLDATAPTVESATVTDSTLTVTFSEDMKNVKADTSAFAVQVAGTSRNVSSYTLSDRTAVLKLASAVKASQSVTLGYAKPKGNAMMLVDLIGNELASFKAMAVTNNTVDTIAPTVAIEPANGTTINVRSGNIVLTFSEPVYADTSQTALTAKTAEDLMDLKQNNKGIAFTPSVTTTGADTVITLDPKQDLADGNVSVKVSSAFYDASGNQGSGMNATFTLDATAPTVESATVTDSTLTVTFSEDMKNVKADTSAFAVQVAGTSRNVSSYTLSDRTAILTLASAVKASQSVTLGYTKPKGNAMMLVDLIGNELASFKAMAVTNNTVDTIAPTVAIEPSHGETINARSGNIVLTFSEPVYADTSQTALTAKTAEDLMDLKQNNKGIAFTPSVTTTGADTVITLDPKQDLADGNVSVKVSSAFYDASGNQGSGMNATFTVDATAPKVESATVTDSTLTVTFSEDMKNVKADTSAFAVQVAGTSRNVSSYTLSDRTAILTLASAVKASQSVTLGYNATALADLAGNDLAPFKDMAITNNTVDTTAPTATSATVAGTTLTVTFSEDMKNAKADTSAFAVQVAGTSRDVSSYTLSGKTAVLTLASAVKASQSVTLGPTTPRRWRTWPVTIWRRSRTWRSPTTPRWWTPLRRR